MKLRAKLLFISLGALGVPLVALLAVALTLIAENGSRSQEKYFLSILDSIQNDVDVSAAQYRTQMEELGRGEYFLTKLYFYNKYWHYIDPETMRSDIQLLKTELESFLLTKGIDTIAVYRTDYNRYVQVLLLGNGTYVPDVVYRDTIAKYADGMFYQQIAEGVYVNFFLPIVSGGKQIGLLVFQRGYDRSYFEALSLRYDVGLALHMQGFFRYSSLPGIDEAWKKRPRTPSGSTSLTGTYTHDRQTLTYVARHFEITDGAGGYIVVGSPAALNLGDWWSIFLRLAVIPLVCVALAAVVFYLWGSKLLGLIRELRQAADRIGKGDLAISLADHRRDELGELFRGFNKMAADLRDNAVRLEDSRRQLLNSEKLATLGEFAAGVAHEINNPLGIVLNHVQLLRMRKLSEGEEDQVLARMESEIKRMGKLLRNLLDQARTDDYVLTTLSLKALIDEMLRLFEPKFKSRNVGVLLDQFPETCDVVGDRDALKQVFFNIVNNALQAIRHRHGEIRISARNEDPHCLVSIQDNGVGMDGGTLARIFEPFFSRKTGHGTGLGLALSSRIMKRHEGSIQVQSTPEEGTKITLVFPRRMDHDSAC